MTRENFGCPLHPYWSRPDSAVVEAATNAAVSVLNEALSLDPIAINSLVNERVSCNRALAEHPEIEVRPTVEGDVIGLLGILNGILRRIGGVVRPGPIGAVVAMPGQKLEGFEIVPEPPETPMEPANG